MALALDVAPAPSGWRGTLVRAGRRVRASLWPVTQAALAAALAWVVAHDLLGHAQPFFAPIAAAIALSTSPIQRSRRIVQMLVGVLLGIAVGELLSAVLPLGAVSLAIVVFVAMLASRLLGEGFVGDGFMFVNQATASAILVMVLYSHEQGAGTERALDAVVGGLCAAFVGVLLFPSDPLPRLQDAERAVLRSLVGVLDGIESVLAAGGPAPPDFALATGHEIHERVAQLALVRSTARVTVRVAPRRWRQRGVVDAEERRIARLDLLANAILTLARLVARSSQEGEPLPESLQAGIATLATTIQRLLVIPQPWQPQALSDVRDVIETALMAPAPPRIDRAPIVAEILRAAARDVRALIDVDV